MLCRCLTFEINRRCVSRELVLVPVLIGLLQAYRLSLGRDCHLDLSLMMVVTLCSA